jgi:BirA family biotin operon repressor/biotin-[acetyl-CoA-carboxylase] ligase
MRLDWLKSYNLLIFETIDSTNSEALRLANSGAGGDFVIISNIQTGGRGSKGRLWKSIVGNLHTSILLDSPVAPKRHPQLSFVVANAVFDSLTKIAQSKQRNLNIQLKWPNDILINGRKVGGILLESITLGSKNYIAIGIGINIIEAPANVSFPATSLYDEGIILGSSDELLNLIISRFDKLYKQWIADNSFIRTRKDWMRRAYNLNKVITIDDGNRRLSGLFKEIDFDGSIRIQLAGGQLYNLAVGDVL